MELKEFISKALIDIVEGVKNANNPYKEGRKEIYDKFELTGEKPVQGMNETKKGTYVDFDIAVIINEDEKDKTKSVIGLSFSYLAAGKSSEKDKQSSKENTHRLKFKVFVAKN